MVFYMINSFTIILQIIFLHFYKLITRKSLHLMIQFCLNQYILTFSIFFKINQINLFVIQILCKVFYCAFNLLKLYSNENR